MPHCLRSRHSLMLSPILSPSLGTSWVGGSLEPRPGPVPPYHRHLCPRIQDYLEYRQSPQKVLITGKHRTGHGHHDQEKPSSSVWPGHLRASVRTSNAVKPMDKAWPLCPGLALSLYIPGPQGQCGSCVPGPCCHLGHWASSCLQACGRN